MGFSSIPLPRVVSDVGPGGALTTDQNAILQNRILGAQAQYAPQQAQANAFLTAQQAKFLPYQQMMSILSNPMAWMAAKDNPAMLQQMTTMMSNLPNMSSNMNQWPLPQPQSNGLLPQLKNSLMNALGMGGDQQNPMQSSPMPSQQAGNALNQAPSVLSTSQVDGSNFVPGQRNVSGSPLVPATQGTMSGMMGSMTAPYTQTPYKPGSAIPDPNNPGHVIYTPTQPTSTAIQTQLLGQERVAPQIERLATIWGPFMDVHGMSELTKGRIGEAFGRTVSPDTLKSFGLEANPDLASQYAEAEATVKTAPEALVKAYGLRPTNETLSRLEKAVVPIWGESADTYKDRMFRTLEQLRTEQGAPSKEALQSGFSSAPISPISQPQSAQNEGLQEVNLGNTGQAMVQATKVLNGRNYAKINGKWYQQ